jgi:leucyl-tRNA synthetase
LAVCEEWVNVACPACGEAARRETDVSDNFLDSAWYYVRYPSAQDEARAFEPEMSEKWLPVDCYVGGNEHACLHLLYTRFISMVLCDHAGLRVGEKADKRDPREPFLRFQANGMIRRGGAKMSKSRGNVVNPDDIVEKCGADTLRVYLLYLGRFEQGSDWRDDAVHGVRRFLDRVHAFFLASGEGVPEGEAMEEVTVSRLHQTIRKVTEDIEAFSYNTAISALMMLLNDFRDAPALSREARETFCIMLSPFAPHLAEEVWCEALGNAPSVVDAPWPECDLSRCVEASVEIAVQVNGKVRGRVSVPRDADEVGLREAVKACPNAQRYIAGKHEMKFLIVPNRLVNVIVR